MALLTRFLPLNDPNDTQIFSFVVTKSVTRDLNRDVVSKEFSYGWQKWAITFSRQEKTLGFLLAWKNPSECLKVTLDAKFTLINRERFSENREFFVENATFRGSNLTNGNKTFIKIAELLSHRPRFVDTNGEFQVELKLSNIKTVFENEFFIQDQQSSSVPLTDKTSSVSNSSEFSYGAFNWVVSVKSVVLPIWKSNTTQGVAICLTRSTSPATDSLLARVGYKICLGSISHSNVITSEKREDMVSVGQSGHLWSPKVALQELYSKSIPDGGYLKVNIDLLSSHSLTEFLYSPKVQEDKADQTPNKVVSEGMDSDHCRWSLEADLHSSFLRFSLILRDVDKILRNHLRYVQWHSYLVRRPKKWRGLRDDIEHRELIDFQSGNVFSRYYSQDESDQGVIMETTISTKDIKEGLSEFLEEGNTMRIRIQWDYIHQLFQSTFHQYDDVYKFHNHQMKNEIELLNEKVRALELQLEEERGSSHPLFEEIKINTSLAPPDSGDTVTTPITRSPSPVPPHLRGNHNQTSRSPSPRRSARKLILPQFSLDGTCSIRPEIKNGNTKLLLRGKTVGSPCPPSSVGSMSPSTPPPNLLSATPRAGISPPFRRFFAPIQHSLSLSAENIVGKKSTITGIKTTSERTSPISKCQSVD